MVTPEVEIEKPSGKTYANPGTGQNTEFVPAGALTADGRWVPIQALPDGSLVVSTEAGGLPHFDDAEADITPGIEQALIDETVPDNMTRYVAQVIVATRVTGLFKVMAGTEVIGSGRTGPGCSGVMPFVPPRPLAAGTEYKVLFTSRLNAPVQSVECYVQASDV